MRADSGNRKTQERAWPVSNSPAPSQLPMSATDHRPLNTDHCLFPNANGRFPTAFFTRRLP